MNDFSIKSEFIRFHDFNPIEITSSYLGGWMFPVFPTLEGSIPLLLNHSLNLSFNCTLNGLLIQMSRGCKMLVKPPGIRNNLISLVSKILCSFSNLWLEHSSRMSIIWMSEGDFRFKMSLSAQSIINSSLTQP